MSQAVVVAKTDPQTKKEAQKVAEKMGISLSGLINGLLKEVIKTKRVTFSAEDEIPSARLIKSIKYA